MAVRRADAEWHGDLKSGKGKMAFGGGAFEGQYSYASRFEEGPGTNPEELIGAAHAGCFSMALAGLLAQAGFPPQRIHTEAKVHLNKSGDGFSIMRIDLHTQAAVPGIDDARFQHYAEEAKRNCPVSQALASVPEITLEAQLMGGESQQAA